MNDKDLILLQKCMNMLSSPEKGEVLAAARAVTELQKAKSINLVGLFKDTVSMRKKLEQDGLKIIDLNKKVKQHELTIKCYQDKTIIERVFKWKKLK